MVQVLHLVNRESDLQSERTSEAIRRAAGAGVEIITRTIGRGGSYRNAAQAAMALRFGRDEQFDVVHAWDVPSLLAACGSPAPIVFSPAVTPCDASAWLRAAMVYRNARVIATTATMRRSLISRGVAASRCDVIPPAVDFGRIPGGRNDLLRDAMGISAEDRILLAPGESIRSAGHRLTLHTASILHVLDPRYRLLIWGRGSSAAALARLAATFNQPRVLVVAEQRLRRSIEFEELLGTADMALVTASAVAPALPMAMCMAAGLPIVAVETGATHELLNADQTASVVPQPAPRLLAKAVIDLFEDGERMAHLGRFARSDGMRKFDLPQTVVPFLSVYRRAAGITPKGVPVALNSLSAHPSYSGSP